MTTLQDAIEAGYAKHPGKWGTGDIYNRDEDTYCAMGLALEGLGYEVATILDADKQYMLFRILFDPSYIEQYTEYTAVSINDLFLPSQHDSLDARVWSINDHSTSYEDMMLKLKEAGLAQEERRA